MAIVMTVSVTLVFLSILFSVYAASSFELLREKIVFPQHLESRADTGERVVRISDNIVLNLEKTSLFGDEITVVSFDEDGNEKALIMPGREAEKDLYHDQRKLAAVHLTHDGGFQVEGVVGPRHRIRPLLEAERSSDGHVAHLLFEIEPNRDSYPESSEYVVTSPLISAFQLPSFTAFSLYGGKEPPVLQVGVRPGFAASSTGYGLQLISENMNEREEHQGLDLEKPQPEARYRDVIIPEITIFADAPFSKFFSYNELKVQRYLAVMITCVNLRFRSVQNPFVWIRPTNIVMLNVAKETFMALSGPLRVYDKRTLENIPRKMHRDIIRYYKETDLTMTVTARELINSNGDPFPAGYAMTGTACTAYKVGIAEDQPGTYNGVETLAHEIAHVLGARHDGDPPIPGIHGHPGAYACPSSHGYIMSYVSRDERQFRFSTCTLQQIGFMAHYEGRNCLLKINVRKKIRHTFKLPSQMIKLDNYCKHIDKENRLLEYYQPTRSNNAPPCKVYCRKPNSFTYWIYKTPDGFACNGGRKGVCIMGVCKQRPDIKALYKDAYARVPGGVV